MTDLMPPNASLLERRITAVAADIERADAPIHTLWDAQRVPLQMLPWLAWAVGVDDWSRHWPEQTQRAAVADAIQIRRRRGTPWAIRRALEVLGYNDVEILEHAQQDQEWQDAGGSYLDACWLLDAARQLGGDLVDPPRVVTVSWAQYALGFNVADAPMRVRDQRRLRRRIEDAAPLRSELVALIYRYATVFDALITLTPARIRARLRFDGCAGMRVPRAVPIMGCWSLSGSYRPVTLNAEYRLRGNIALRGKIATGPSIDQGWGTVGIGVRQRSKMGLQVQSENHWLLGETNPDRLDGKWALNETLGEHRALGGGWPIGAAALYQPRPVRLNGARLLGGRRQIDSIGTTATATARQRRLQAEIHLDHGRPATKVPWRHWSNTARYTRLSATVGISRPRLAIRLPVGFAETAQSDNRWHLGDTLSAEPVNWLDGRWALNETINARRSLDGAWALSLGQLTQPAAPVPLSGARRLGAHEKIQSAGTTATGIIRDRRKIKEIRL